MESVSFDTLTFDHPAACRPARVTATLHLPPPDGRPAPCMVILTSSAGVQRHREHYYAQALNDAGAAALIVDSFTGRGVRRTVADQTLVSGAQMEGDAFAALALLRGDSRIDPGRIGVMGVSKGAVATLNTAIEWFGFCLIGSLFPDIDIGSKGRYVFYRIFLLFLLANFFGWHKLFLLNFNFLERANRLFFIVLKAH